MGSAGTLAQYQKIEAWATGQEVKAEQKSPTHQFYGVLTNHGMPKGFAKVRESMRLLNVFEVCASEHEVSWETKTESPWKLK